MSIPQIPLQLTRCMLIVPSGKIPRFPASNQLCLQEANKPVPMVLFGARDNCDMSFQRRVAHSEGVREGGPKGVYALCHR